MSALWRSGGLCAVLAVAGASCADAQAAQPIPGGELRIVGQGPADKIAVCPLEHTEVEADIAGYLARVRVRQVFRNPLDRKIEAVYVFPLPADAAVDRMVMLVGDRRIIGQVRERAEAREIYEQAKAAGHVAGLLEQQRPNIFTQQVANIEPGVKVVIEITFVQTVPYRDGEFVWSFPTVVAPRYIPGRPTSTVPPVAPEQQDQVLQPLDDQSPERQRRVDQSPERKRGVNRSPERKRGVNRSPERKRGVNRSPERKRGVAQPRAAVPHPQGTGWSPDTDQVPDASRITPHVVRKGYRSGHDISIRVNLDAGLPIEQIESELHEIDVELPQPQRAVITLKQQREIPNRDFVLRYRLAAERLADACLLHEDDRGRFCALILQPPRRVEPEHVLPRELVFVLDVSGSMRGEPLNKSKQLMRRLLDSMRPEDRFNVVTFAGQTGVLWDAPRPASAENIAQAWRFIRTRRGGGGTEMMRALQTALQRRADADRPQAVRMVIFLTDGLVGNDLAIIEAVKRHAATTRVFALGVGNAPNRFLLDGIARAGRGAVEYVTLQRDADAVIERFARMLSTPVLTDIEIDFGDLPVEDVVPRHLPDLFAEEPLVVFAKLREPRGGTIRIRGRTVDGPYEDEVYVEVPGSLPQHPAIATLWARAKIDELMRRNLAAVQRGTFPPELRSRIVELGVRYGLVTQFTSFVAVEELTVTSGGEPVTIEVPVEMPQGMSYKGVFGGRPGSFVPTGPKALMRAQTLSLSGRPRVSHPVVATGGALPASPRSGGPAVRGVGEVAPPTGDVVVSVPLEPRLKLAGPLRDLAAKVRREGHDGTLTLGKLRVVRWRVDVVVSLEKLTPQVRKQLEAAGLKVKAESALARVLVGSIDVRKLLELAKIEAVRQVRPLVR